MHYICLTCANKVYLIYHGKDKLRCEKALLNNLREKDNIEVIYNSNVVQINGEDELESIIVENGEENTELDVKVCSYLSD